MRINTSTIVVFFICLALGVAYYFLGKGEINKRINEVQAVNAQLTHDLDQIRLKEAALPGLLDQLPIWREQVELFRAAIPSAIDDDKFLAAITDQLPVQDVELLGLDVMLGGPWLGKLGEDQVTALEENGIDAEMAQRILVAFYSVRLIGQFDGVISTFENLKSYKRLYTIDEVTGPAAAGAGAVRAIADPDVTPIQVTGRIYFGLPREDIDFSHVIRVFGRAKLRPMAEAIKARAQRLLQDAPAGNSEAINGADAAVTPADVMEVPTA